MKDPDRMPQGEVLSFSLEEIEMADQTAGSSSRMTEEYKSFVNANFSYPPKPEKRVPVVRLKRSNFSRW